MLSRHINPLLKDCKGVVLALLLFFMFGSTSYAQSGSVNDVAIGTFGYSSPRNFNQYVELNDYTELEIGKCYKITYDVDITLKSSSGSGGYMSNPVMFLASGSNLGSMLIDTHGSRLTVNGRFSNTGTAYFEYSGSPLRMYVYGVFNASTTVPANVYRLSYSYDFSNLEEISGIPDSELEQIRLDAYSDGFSAGVAEGVASVDTQSFYDSGYSAGYALGYQAGLSANNPTSGDVPTPSNPLQVLQWTLTSNYTDDDYDIHYINPLANPNVVINPNHVYHFTSRWLDDSGDVTSANFYIGSVDTQPIGNSDFYISGSQLGRFVVQTRVSSGTQYRIRLYDVGESGVIVDTGDLDSKLDEAQTVSQSVGQFEDSLFYSSSNSLDSYSPEPLTDRDGSIAFVASWIQSFYESSGEFATVVTMLFIISICGTAIGYYVSKKG